MKHSQQHHSNYHQRQHLDYKIDSPKATHPKRNETMHKSCGRLIEHLEFHPKNHGSALEEHHKNAIHLYCHTPPPTPLAKAAAGSQQTPDT
jgi:hypothetical protein